MLNDGDFVGDCIYAKWMVMTWWIVCVNICIVVESYVHAFMTDGDGFYIQLRWLWCAVGIMGWRPRRCWWRYHMHLEVLSRNKSCCGMSPSCSNNLVFDVNADWYMMVLWIVVLMLKVRKNTRRGEGGLNCVFKNFSFLRYETCSQGQSQIEFRVLMQRIDSKSAEKERTQSNYTGSFHKPEVVLSPLHFQGEFH